MKGKFILLMTALMLLAGMPLAKAQAPANTVLWSESWDNGVANATPADYLASDNNATVVYGDAEITYASGNGSTKLYNATLAGGTAPELLLAGSDTWTITGVPTGGAAMMTLSYKSNNTKASVSSPTEGITITANTSKADTYTYTIENDGNTTFDIVFSASGNTRLDDVVLLVKGEDQTYTLAVSTSIEHGSISLSADEAAFGTIITVTATPDDSYILESLYYNDGTENTTIDITTKQFAMPAANITVGATFTTMPDSYMALISEDQTDWSGKYILAYSKDGETLLALNGYTTYGTVANIAEHLYADGIISANSTTLPLRLDIAQTENGYSIHMDNVGYFGLTSDANALNVAETVEDSQYEWTIAFVNDTLKIGSVSYPERFLQCNISANPKRFACYKGTQKFPSLFKFIGEEQQYTINIADGIENGTVEASAETANAGEEITITATPDNGYELTTLTYVYDDNDPIDIKETLSFNMPAADVTVNATFSLIPTTEYNIVIADGIENGTIEASAETAVEGTSITITVTPAENYFLEALTYVYGDNDPIDITETKSFVMPAADVTINATFAALPDAYFAPVTEELSDWSGQYIIVFQADATHLMALNRVFTLGTNSIGDTTNVYEYVINGLVEANDNTTAIRVDVASSTNGYTLKLHGNGYLGWVSGNTLVAADTVESDNYEWVISFSEGKTIIANAHDNSRLLKYNTGSPRFATYSNTTTNYAQLYRYYGQEIQDPTYTLTVADGIQNGTIELSTYEAQEGEEITVTVTPDEGYMLETLSYTYGDVETIFDIDQETLTFNMPAGDVVVTGTFKLIPTVEYNIVIADGIEGGTVEASATTAVEGTEITVTVTSNEGFILETLTYVYGDVDPIDIKATKSFEMPAADVTINATFAELLPPEVGDILWSEPWDNGAANATPEEYLASENPGTVVYGEAELVYSSVNTTTITKLYNENLAGGTAPELLVAKNGGSFTASGIPTGGVSEMLLTYKANNTNITVSTTTEGITITAKENKAAATYTYVIANTQNKNVFDLTFSNSASSNTRLDDILLTVKGPDPTYTLTVADGIQNGTIELSTYEAQEGEEITVTVTPDEGYMLETLSYTYGDVETIFDIDQETLTFEMPAGDVVVTGTFKLIPTTEYNIVVADGIENGTIEASATTAVEGTVITITATPAENYMLETLTYVYEGVDPIDIKATKSFEMPAADVTINATFAEMPETYFAPVTENLDDWSGDYIMTYRVDEDRLMALSRVFLYYTTNIGDTININQYYDNTTGFVEANDNTLAIRINIEPSENGYTLNLNESGYIGWLSGNSMVAAETVENSNYEWTLNYENDTMKILNVADPTRIIRYNTNSPRFATYSLTSSVKNPVSLYKYYGPEIVDPTYTLTVADGIQNGSIELSTYEATAGTTITVTATPDEGYKLESLSYTYNETVADIDTAAMTFVMPHADVEVTATFKLIPTTEYTITIAQGIENGTIAASAETALEETPITVEATPDEGYVLETLTYVYGNEEPIDITNEMGFIMPAADVIINATFAELPESYFEPVTENLDDWTGEYIMAYRMSEDQLYALNSIVKIGSNYVGDTLNVIEYLNNGLIEANGATTAIRIDIEPSENGYTLNLNNNGYLGWLSGNTMVAAETVENSNYEWTLSYENDTMRILNVADNTRMIKFNTNSPRFAAYALTSSVQTSVTLYKYYGPEIVDETYTLTVADTENGSIELSTYEATAGTTITVTATPDEGYVLGGLTYTYGETTTDIDLAALSFTMPAANTVVSATFVEEAAVPAITAEMLPQYIQGKDGTNNNRLPYAYRVTISHLIPNATYRYVNQIVTADDNANYDGVGNAIYVDCEGDFIRTTSVNLTDAGNYGEFTTDENGEYTGWFVSEATGNNRFTPGNHVYMRIRINDGNEGTTAEYKLTTTDYATVINFGTENEAAQGTAIVGKTEDNDKSFVFLFDNEQGEGRPVYGTTIESTGVDYAGISQYATFYQNQVASNSGFWGGIIPNVNDNGIRFVGVYDNCTGAETNNYVAEDGDWDGTSTVNPVGGTGSVLFIDFTTLGVNETESGITIWNRTNEIVIDMAENDSYRMTVYNILGQPVMSRDINGVGSHSVTHKLAAGLYIINLSNNDNSISTKIVVR